MIIAIMLLIGASSSAWASNIQIKRLVDNPYYFLNGVWKVLPKRNVPCHRGTVNCVQQTPDGMQQLYANGDFFSPLEMD